MKKVLAIIAGVLVAGLCFAQYTPMSEEDTNKTIDGDLTVVSNATVQGTITVSGAVTIVEGALANSTVVSADIKDDAIVNADVKSDAAIVRSKLSLGGSSSTITYLSATAVTGAIYLADGVVTNFDADVSD